MAQITLGALTTLSLSTHLDPMFTDLYGYSKNLTSDALGNVGIGITPAYKLHVNGRISYSGAIGEGADTTLDSATTTIRIAPSATWTALAFFTAGVERARFDASGNFTPVIQVTPPALGTNQQMVFNLTSNTNLRISVRGTDAVTRVANITLA